MKIALVNHTYSLSHGGLERFAVNLALSLRRAEHDVHVFGMTASGLPSQIPVHILSIPRKPSWRRIFSFHREAARAVRVEGFDIVFGLTRFFPMDIYRMGDGVQRHWMRIRYPFGPWRWLNYLLNPVHLLNFLFERKILAGGGAKRIITNSRLCKEHAQSYYGVPEERIDVVYNGVDHDYFNPRRLAAFREETRRELGLGPEDTAVLHISNNWSRKGLGVTLKAIGRLGERGRRLHLLVVGRGRPAPFRKLAATLGIEDRVHFVGPTAKVECSYAAGDLLVLPTLYDPFSNVCLEAMACGLPVITTAGNGAAEIIEEGITGCVQREPKDDRELARIIESNCLDPVAIRRMGEAALKVAQEYTPERNMRGTLEVCGKIAAEKLSTSTFAGRSEFQ